jgi:hypothetical protein
MRQMARDQVVRYEAYCPPADNNCCNEISFSEGRLVRVDHLSVGFQCVEGSRSRVFV